MLTKIAVNNVVKLELTVSHSFKSLARSIVTAFIEAFHCLKESLVLLWIWAEFHHQRLLHPDSVEQYVLHVKDYFRKEDSRNSSVA